MRDALAARSLPWPAAAGALHAAYFALHYLFASQTAHLASLGGAFMSMLIAAGAPPKWAVFTIAFNTNLNGGLTHFASGQSACYFGADYCDMATFLRVGSVCGWCSLALWAGAGTLWWKLIGLC